MAHKKVIRGPKPRNLLAKHPLLRKGGAHEKTRKAERQSAKQQLRTGHDGF